MLEQWVFMIALLMVSLLFLFHGCILLFSPDRYIPSYTWGQSSLKFSPKPSRQIGKRFIGLVMSAAIIWFFTRPSISWILHPKQGNISLGESPFSRTLVRWDLLGVTIFAIGAGYLLFTRAEKSVETMFAADRDRLRDRITFRLWTIYIQVAAFSIMVLSLLPLADFIRSLR